MCKQDKIYCCFCERVHKIIVFNCTTALDCILTEIPTETVEAICDDCARQLAERTLRIFEATKNMQTK